MFQGSLLFVLKEEWKKCITFQLMLIAELSVLNFPGLREELVAFLSKWNNELFI